VIAGAVIAIVWLIRQQLVKPLFAWPLHILIDIPTHTSAFFPTPFLWPLSDYRISGVSWTTRWFFLTNVVVLALWYARAWMRTKNAQH
jgi:hypothetical protein